MARLAGVGVAAAFLLFGAVCANAATLTFDYVGACSFNCGDEGLETGAPASGRVVIDDAGYSPDGFFGSDALVDFSFDFGGIKLDKSGAKAVGFGGPWEVIPGAGLRWYLEASTSDDRVDLGPTISVSGGADGGAAEASFLGTCEASDFGCSATFHTAAQFELTPAAPVPLPPAALLLVGGLACLGGLRLRRVRRAGG